MFFCDSITAIAFPLRSGDYSLKISFNDWKYNESGKFN